MAPLRYLSGAAVFSSAGSVPAEEGWPLRETGAIPKALSPGGALGLPTRSGMPDVIEALVPAGWRAAACGFRTRRQRQR